jgi:hypothetical protein
MKKILFILFLLAFAVAVVSAADTINYDFGNFTADIPSDSDIENGTDVVYHNVDSRYMNLNPDNANVTEYQYDKKNNITYYFDKKPDDGNFTEFADSNWAKELESENGLHCYNISSVTGVIVGDKYDHEETNIEYCVIKEQDGFLWMPGEHVVKITGPDLGQIKEIAGTVKFK